MDGTAGGTVLALIGVLLGTVGTLVGQHLARRVEAQRDQQHRAAAKYAERKEAILGFLAAAQRVELVLDRRNRGLPTVDGPEDEKLHALWLAKKPVELTCSHEAAQAAHDYAKALHEQMRGAVANGRTAKRERLHSFMEIARGELGSDHPPLQR
ncbi:hypothetical protein [Streptomyces griseocarneus]|uniref:hypothetical protein n=1 Tax=Streptomyces griseocarneus TaxID=51201 RepID=UPI00167D2DE2|nr:hypothetical protein [Streptomyces griseocarneus]MBZ6476721.1 hypothetical protein [Streptomyces griseocarneus]GHG80536.1 hypothetical protein GCM10018779_62190 [Streptomyces griseocarneus]